MPAPLKLRQHEKSIRFEKCRFGNFLLGHGAWNHRVEREGRSISEAISLRRSSNARAHKKSKPFSSHATDFSRFRRELLPLRPAFEGLEGAEKTSLQHIKGIIR